MTDIPARCPKCHTIFPSGFNLENARNISIKDCSASCPRCGTISPVAAGVFSVVDGVIGILSGSQLTIEMVHAFQGVLSDAAKGHLTPVAAVRRAKKIDRRLGTAIKVTLNFGLPGLSLLAAVIAIYLAHMDSESTSELNKRMFAEMKRQTEIMQTMAPQSVPQVPRAAGSLQRAVPRGKPRA